MFYKKPSPKGKTGAFEVGSSGGKGGGNGSMRMKEPETKPDGGAGKMTHKATGVDKIRQLAKKGRGEIVQVT